MIQPDTLSLLTHVDLCYQNLTVLEDFSMQVPSNQITCIVGPSGCGKTTILNLISGLLQPDRGHRIQAHHPIGYIFQEDRLLPWETVYQNIRIVRKKEDKMAILSLLKTLELDEFQNSYPEQLSGGLKQRCALARGFYYGADLLLMDEPFKSLDYDLRLNLITYLGKLWQKSRPTIIFVTHDIDEALLLGHHILVLSKRPTKIIQSHSMQKKLGQRQVTDDQHIQVRRQIINQLTNRILAHANSM